MISQSKSINNRKNKKLQIFKKDFLLKSQDFNFKNNMENNLRSNSLIPLKDKKLKKKVKQKIPIKDIQVKKKSRLPFFKKKVWEELNSNQKQIGQLFTTKYENFLLLFLYEKKCNEFYNKVLLPKCREIKKFKYPNLDISSTHEAAFYEKNGIINIRQISNIKYFPK